MKQNTDQAAVRLVAVMSLLWSAILLPFLPVQIPLIMIIYAYSKYINMTVYTMIQRYMTTYVYTMTKKKGTYVVFER